MIFWDVASEAMAAIRMRTAGTIRVMIDIPSDVSEKEPLLPDDFRVKFMIIPQGFTRNVPRQNLQFWLGVNVGPCRIVKNFPVCVAFAATSYT
jgi:hypothetical protein